MIVPFLRAFEGPGPGPRGEWPTECSRPLAFLSFARHPKLEYTILLVIIMKRLSIKRRESLKGAWRAQAPHSTGPHSGHFGFLLGCPLLETSSPPKRAIKRKLPSEWNESPRTEPKRARKEAKATEPPPQLELPSAHLSEVERKWHAVLEHKLDEARGVSSHERDEEIAARWSVGCGRTVRNLALQIEERGSLARKPGSGRKPSVTNDPFYLECFGKNVLEWDYEFTHQDMADALKEETGIGSKHTVQRLMQKLEYKRRLRVIRPFLTEAHMKDRHKWAKRWARFSYARSPTCVIWIDEKCFYAFKSRGVICYCPPGVDPKPDYALSKTQIPWVMFLGAVGIPRPERGFDGKIGLWHVGEEKAAQRRSKYHEAGDTYWVNVNMTGEVFVRMVKEYLIPAVLAKCQWAKKVVICLDSAGGHRINESLPTLNGLGKQTSPPITFECQPTRSPDCNLLDLGIWNSMQSRVSKVKYDRISDKSMDQRIIDAVMEMWQDYPGHEVLPKLGKTLTAVHRQIILHQGGNSFAQPRKL